MDPREFSYTVDADNDGALFVTVRNDRNKTTTLPVLDSCARGLAPNAGRLRGRTARDTFTQYPSGPDYGITGGFLDRETRFTIAAAVEALNTQERAALPPEVACPVVNTITALMDLPEGSHVWGASDRYPDVPGTGAPYVKVDDEWADYANGYSVGADDIRLPALVVFSPRD
jgi:hypothetical protein